jgi:hypothetical protein
VLQSLLNKSAGRNHPAEKVESKSLIRHGFLIFLYPDNSTAERACDTGVRQQMILRINLVLREQ